MNVKLLTALTIMLASSLVAGSPPYEVAELMRRAPTVALVAIGTRDAGGVTLRAKTIYRGAITRDQYVHIDPKELPDGVGMYVALSQSDAASGPPTDDAHLGQTLVGQHGYRGWLLYPIRSLRGHEVIDPALLTARDSELRVDQLAAFVARHPYRKAGE